MQKTIVTHYSPDFDGIPGIWLLKRFHPDFTDAKVAFAPAGETIDGKGADDNPDIVYVDTGHGRFDHHQTNDYTCGAKLVWEWIKQNRKIEDEAIERIIELVTAYDHAKDLYWPEADHDRYDLALPQVLVGWKLTFPGRDQEYVEWVLHALDGVYTLFKSKVAAEREIKEKGKKFSCPWGEGIAVETENDGVLDAGERQGWGVVMRKDPKRGFLRISARADRGIDLTGVYEELKKQDSEATWFLHASKLLIRNGSTRNPKMKPTKLTLDRAIAIFEKLKK